MRCAGVSAGLYISIHSLHTEGDGTTDIALGAASKFKSTPSTRRETSS